MIINLYLEHIQKQRISSTIVQHILGKIGLFSFETSYTMLSSTQDHDRNKTQLEIFRKNSHISQEIHAGAITTLSKQSLERLTDIRNALSDVSLHCDGSPWTGICFRRSCEPWWGRRSRVGWVQSVGCCQSVAHALLHTVSCDTEPVYAQWQKRSNYRPLTSASPRGLCFVTGTSLETKNVSAYLIQLQHRLIPKSFLFIAESLS